MAQLPPRLQRARIRLMLDQPYLAAAVARLPLIDAAQTAWCKTMATDGYHIFVNPAFAAELADDELVFVLAHEVLHCVLGHLDRRQDRMPAAWNVAIDYAVNLLLVEFGLTMPPIGLLDRIYRGMTAEEIYRRLDAGSGVSAAGGAPLAGATRTSGAGRQELDGFDLHLDPDDPRAGSLRSADAPSPEERKRMRITLTRELQSQLHGRMPGLLVAEMTAATSNEVPWEALLARFVTGLRRSDYRLFPPNRKHIWRNLYLPTAGVPGPEHLVVAIDTSGSMDDQTLARVLGEVDRLRVITECRLTLIQCDAAVQHVDEYESFEATPSPGSSYHIVGRGGTDFRPVYHWVQERLASGLLRLDALIYLTDGYGRYPEREPPYPVLWIVEPHGARDIPFGTVIRLARSA